MLPRKTIAVNHKIRFSQSCLFLAIASCVAGQVAAQDAPLAPLEDSIRASECLTLAIAYEAGYESVEGKQAVAEVVLNRVRDPLFPKTVCGVVFAGSNRRTGCQFTFTCDGSLYRRVPARAVLDAARLVAGQALSGAAPSRVPGATHYHADYVSPRWAPRLTRVAKIGTHIFYQSAGTGIAAIPGARLAPVGADDLPRTDASQAVTPAPASGGSFAPWGLTLPPASAARAD